MAGVCEGDAAVVSCHSYMKPMGGNLSVAEHTT